MSLACRVLLLLSIFKEHVNTHAAVPDTKSVCRDEAGVCPRDNSLLQTRTTLGRGEPLTLIKEMRSGDKLEQEGHEGASASANRTADASTAMCARPSGWCVLSHEGYLEIDCDGDGVKDPYCESYPNSGFISSASSCRDMWPSGGCPSQMYVPGTPGANWTVEEMLIVRAKIQRMMDDSSLVWEAAHLFGYGKWFNASFYSFLNAAKILRLGFHDCLKYEDGTGGCDGCLQWDRMEFRGPWNGVINASDRPDGGNNGLTTVVHVLEAIYVDRRFPSNTPLLPMSLQTSGKSRADLWAFAVIESVRYSMELNNWACDEPDEVEHKGQCAPRLGESDCKFAVPVFSFQTGREDCIATESRGFKTNKAESHPDPHMNGKNVVDFMQHDFGFSGQETVAIMGAHTIGGFHIHITMFRYTWKTKSGGLFNNGYYRNLAMKPDWYYPVSGVGSRPCGENFLTNSTGERPLARFATYAWGATTAGGPVQWVQEKLICPYCNTMNLVWQRASFDSCCRPYMSTQFEANLNQTNAEREAIDYKFGPVNTTSCPANYEAINDRAACLQAAHSLQRPFDDIAKADFPHGCLLSIHHHVYFNPSGTISQSDINHHLVCRANVSAYKFAGGHQVVCPEDSEAILDEGACRLAAQNLNMPFYVEGQGWGQHLPLGCLWHGNGNAYFNPHGQNYSWAWNQGPLCRKLTAIPEPSTAACKTIAGEACVFPFKYRNEVFLGCTAQGQNEPGCYTEIDQTGHGVPGHWGTCESFCRLDHKDIVYQGCKDDCMHWMFIPGADECMLSSDMGLYYDFNVTDDGIPSGCQGFENYNPRPSQHNRADPQCPLNALSVPAGTASLSEVVELYANNQTQFVNDFAIALIKMLSNGYSNLTPAPLAGMTGFTCTSPGPHNGTLLYDCQRQPVPNSFNVLGSGYCNTGYYAGWVAADAVDLETCQAKCLTEYNCKFISLKVGASCSRYDSSAGSCSNRASGHSDHQSYARQLQPVANSFYFLGSGYCNTGYYAGWVAAEAVDLETCQRKCLTESNCKFISLKVGISCSRYDSPAGSCSNRASGHSDHQSYARY